MITDFKVHAETCLLIVFSSLGCVVFLPMVLSNFLGGLSNHENTNKAQLDDVHERWLSRHGVRF